MHGVAIVGHPVARKLDDGLTVEIYRVCTDGTYNACSMLYGACARIAREMGYKRIITYTLVSEPEYPICECCGKKIDHINTSVFNYDGTDSDRSIPVVYEPVSGCVSFTTTPNWTDYDLTDEERKEGIRCPYCGKYPFDKECEIELYEPVEVMMWVTKEKTEES